LSDFYQLPGVKGKFSLAHYVPPRLDIEASANKHIPLEVSEFCAMSFTSHVWRQANFTCVELSKMFTQPPPSQFREASCTQLIQFTDTAKQMLFSFNAWEICVPAI
jgi:hypothetical protein